MATKTRVPIIAVTPVKGGPSTSMYTATEKQSLLDNFDLEGESGSRDVLSSSGK